MELVSEIDKILDGTLVVETDKLKAIAVSSATISPDDKGVVPLSKQNMMEIEKEEIPENEFVETLEDSPIDVAPLETLEGFDFAPDKEEEKEEEPKKEEVKEEKEEEEQIEISLPEVEDVVVNEPQEVNDNLFVDDEEKEEVKEEKKKEEPKKEEKKEKPKKEEKEESDFSDSLPIPDPIEEEILPHKEEPKKEEKKEKPKKEEKEESDFIDSLPIPDPIEEEILPHKEEPKKEEKKKEVKVEKTHEEEKSDEELIKEWDELINKLEKEFDNIINIFRNVDIVKLTGSKSKKEIVNDEPKLLSPEEEVEKEEPAKSSEALLEPDVEDIPSNLMEEATKQINNIKVPSLDDDEKEEKKEESKKEEKEEDVEDLPIVGEELPSVDETPIKGMFI